MFLAGFSLVDQVTGYFDNYIQRQIEQADFDKEMDFQMQIQKERLSRGKKITKYSHKGFDFDACAGHDLLVADSLKNRLTSAI